MTKVGNWTQLTSPTGFVSYILNGTEQEMKSSLSNIAIQTFKSTVKTSKKNIHFAVSKQSTILVLVRKSENQFQAFESGMNVPSNAELLKIANNLEEARTIYLRRIIIKTYTKWLESQLDIQAVLNGKKPLEPIDCFWF